MCAYVWLCVGSVRGHVFDARLCVLQVAAFVCVCVWLIDLVVSRVWKGWKGWLCVWCRVHSPFSKQAEMKGGRPIHPLASATFRD